MKMKKAKSTAAILAVMALTAGFSGVQAAETSLIGFYDPGDKLHSVETKLYTEDVQTVLNGQNLTLGNVTGMSFANATDTFSVDANGNIKGHSFTTDRNSASNIGGVALGYGRVDADMAILDNAQVSDKLTVGSGVNEIAMENGLIRANQFVGESVTTNTLRVGNGDKFNVDEEGNLVLSGDIVADGKVKATGMTVTGDVLMQNGQGESFVMTQGGMQMTSADAEHGTGAVIVKDGNVTLIGGGNTQVDITSDGISTAGGKVTIDNRGVLTADTVMATNGGGIGGVNMIDHTISIYDQTNTTRQFFYDGNGNLALQGDVKAGGALSAMNGNFNVNEDGLTYTTNGSVTSDLAELRVTGDGASLRYRDNGVVVTEDGVTIAGDLKMDGVLNTGDLGADSLSVADGKFRVETDGTMYSQVGKSQLQVRDDLVAMNYGPNTAVMLNEDGVTLKGDVVVEDNLMIGNGMTYFANDGSFTAAGGKFSVGGYGEFTAAGGRFAVTADGQAYIGGTTDPNNAVVTKGDLTNAVEGVENSSVQWDDPQTKDSINGVGLKDGNITADTINVGDGALVVDEEGNTTVGGDLNVEGSLKVNGDYVATADQINDINENINGVKTDVSGIKTEIGINADGSYKDIENGASDVITGINKNTDAIGDVTKLKGTNANGEKYTNLTDAVNGNYDRIEQNTTAIAQNSQAINSLGHRVSDLGDEIDSVGAISAALAGLHPLDYDGTGSKFQISAAMGTYDGTQAAAIGGFYHFNRDVMLSLGGATSFEGDKKTAANIGVTFRVGEGASGKSVSDDVMARLEAMDQKIAALEQENKELKNVLGAIDTSLSKEFPDVPANHWAYEAVTKLAGNDVVAGYPDGEFHGDRTMTRYEMAEVIYKAMQKGAKVDQKLVNEFKPEMEQVAANQNA
ncbi:S-layer homology domain-containing protein [uncultured Megasphaera sp.]|uniref:S-layer homology domain-containing protein n=1 Tax=uncultured Megasphaera sp. TaxID=165188 RepID=UPI002605D9D2|nr:S-layer homology domain-containing protein [uncultured Megasphaera sp.]